ncbi:polycystin-1-like protein 2 [Saccoglossus kowalevskii]
MALFTLYPQQEQDGNSTVVDGDIQEAQVELRSNLLISLSKMCFWSNTIDALLMSSATLSDLTGPGGTTSDALVRAAMALVFMANKLQGIEDQSREEMLETAASLVEGIGNIIKSSIVIDVNEVKVEPTDPPEYYGDDPSPEEIEEYENQQALLKQQEVEYAEMAARMISNLGMGIIDVVSLTVRSTQVVGEPAIRLPSDFLTMELLRDEPENLKDKEMYGTIGSFKLPKSGGVLEEGSSFAFVDIETMYVDGNQYSWDASRSNVKSGVMTMKLSNPDGEELEIKDLVDPITIHLYTDQVDIDTLEVEMDLSNLDTMYNHTFNVTKENIAVELMFTLSSEIPLVVYGKYGELPSPEDVYLLCELPRVESDETIPDDVADEISYICHIPSAKLPEQGEYFMSVMPGVDLTDSSGFVNYTLDIMSYGCSYWNKADEIWTGDGCMVGHYSTSMYVHCLCNHLTSFAADFFIPPNTIDFSTVFDHFDVGNNAAVFSTVISLFCLYCLLMVWARRKDKNDVMKWGVTPLIDNSPRDKYYYEIVVYTGMRQGSGTKSKVNFMLSGEDEDTGIRKLDDDKRKLFERGSINHFVLATPRSLGPLTYLRIWHDDSGKGEHGSWYLSRIMISDLQTGEKFYFLNDKWLAVEYEDGMIDRVLPVASKSELVNFNQLFFHSARQNLSEKHLWFSVVSRPRKSHFTRVQRLSCCLSLLYCSMIASCMFYRAEERAGNVFSINIGPFSLTSYELYVSIMTNLIVFPVNFIVVEIFRKSRPGKSSLTEWFKRRKTRPMSAKFDVLFNDADEVKTTKKKKKKSTFPPWCRYIGWVLCILTCIASAFFVILYSMQWGRKKSEEWLVSLILSFSLSVLVTQPVQVVVIAIFFSCFMRRVTDDDDDESETKVKDTKLKEDEEYMHDPSLLSDSRRKTYLLPPKGDKLEALRKERLNELKMQSILREISIYAVFVLVLCSLCYTNRDSNSFNMTNSIHQTFFGNQHKLAKVNVGFEGLSRTSPDVFWKWVEVSLIPGLYAEKNYNGEELHWRHRRFIENRESYRVGPARIRQLRVQPESCVIVEPMNKVITECSVDYEMYDTDETRSFNPKWTPLGLNQSLSDDDDSVWKYHDAIELNGLPVFGYLSVYGGGGYLAELGTSEEKAYDMIEYLRNNSWYDIYTRAIIIEFTVYNANVNLFSLVTFLIELPTHGGGLLSPSISTFRLYNYVGVTATAFVVGAQVLFVGFVAYFVIHETLKIKREKRGYFKSFWNCLELVLMAFGVTVIVMYAFRQIFTAMALDDVTKNKTKFVNFQHLAYWDTIFSMIIALELFVAMLKFLKLLRFNKRMSMLGMTLKYCFKDLLYFSVIWIIVFLAYCQVFYLVFGRALLDYATMSITMASQISMMLGRFDYHALNEINRIFSKVFFFFFILCLYWILMNMFLTILNQSIIAVKADINKQSNEYEIVDFVWRRFTKFIGMTSQANRRRQQQVPKVKVQIPSDSAMSANDNDEYSDDAFHRSIDRLLGYVLRHYGDIDVVKENGGNDWTMAISVKEGKSIKRTKKIQALTTT